MAEAHYSPPAWLRGGFAAELFQSGHQALGGPEQSQQSHDGRAHVPMAARDNEIFYAVGTSIRWVDLSKVKSRKEAFDSGNGHTSELYKTLNLKRSFAEPIQQLLISPSEDFMAVVTRHSVSVIVLPDVSLLSSDDSTPVSVKRHTVGETTHVKQTPAIAKVLWHPLGLDGNCLVTITVSSVIRLWELDRRNLTSFSSPSQAIDLVKLRHANSRSDDITSGNMNYNKAFSIDNAEMVTTAACFGVNSNEAQAFEWGAATLWLTMAEGDIFALCPLLPSRFQADDDGTIPTLAELKNAQKLSLDADEIFGFERAKIQSQCAWLDDLREQYDNFEDGEAAFSPRRAYQRPMSQGAVPKLQGPFVILPNEAQDDLLPCDIHVIGASTAASLINRTAQPDSDAEPQLGISFSIVSVLGDDGRVYICIDIDGVEPQWLPESKTYTLSNDAPSPAELILFEALDTLSKTDTEYDQYPTFTSNATADEYSFFVSHRKGIYRFSLDAWVHELEKEVQNAGTRGVQFRTQVLTKGEGTQRERVVRSDSRQARNPMSRPILFSTEELGHVLLAVQGQQPHAVMFSAPGSEEEPAPLYSKPGFPHDQQSPYLSGPDRDVYYPPPAFTQQSSLSSFIDKSIEPRHKRSLKEEIRLSSATLQIMTEAHRLLSRETTALNDAAADLFRRCDRLRDELTHQIERMTDTADRIQSVKKGDASSRGDADSSESRKEAIEARLKDVKERQAQQLKRHNALTQRLARAGGKPLSGKEKAWIAETNKIETAVGGDDNEEKDNETRHLLLERFREVQSIANGMLEQAKTHGTTLDGEGGSTNGHNTVPPDIRQGKITEVEHLLERESSLISAALSKLSRLGISSED